MQRTHRLSGAGVRTENGREKGVVMTIGRKEENIHNKKGRDGESNSGPNWESNCADAHAFYLRKAPIITPG